MWSKDTKNVLDLAEVKSGQKIYDLGCGDGKLLFAAARLGAKAEGLEISVLPYLLAKIRQLFSKDKVTIKFRDFWLVNLSDADVVFFFLIPRIYPQLTKKLKKELKPGTKVVAYAWPIKEWQPIKVSKRDEGPAIYLYQI
ncbi:class I SAM-dependent methyltransferase [Candidatus Parcubacteria bacterium]|nr:class I SAM-dependent methyltransferase [Candidatus Parcubacteria bacterium]